MNKLLKKAFLLLSGFLAGIGVIYLIVISIHTSNTGDGHGTRTSFDINSGGGDVDFEVTLNEKPKEDEFLSDEEVLEILDVEPHKD